MYMPHKSTPSPLFLFFILLAVIFKVTRWRRFLLFFYCYFPCIEYKFSVQATVMVTTKKAKRYGKFICMPQGDQFYTPFFRCELKSIPTRNLDNRTSEFFFGFSIHVFHRLRPPPPPPQHTHDYFNRKVPLRDMQSRRNFCYPQDNMYMSRVMTKSAFSIYMRNKGADQWK